MMIIQGKQFCRECFWAVFVKSDRICALNLAHCMKQTIIITTMWIESLLWVHGGNTGGTRDRTTQPLDWKLPNNADDDLNIL